MCPRRHPIASAIFVGDRGEIVVRKSVDIERELQVLDAQAAAISRDLDGLVPASRAEFVVPAAAWVENAVNRRISVQPDTVQALGAERLRELKKLVADFTDRLPSLIEAETSNEKLWPHRQEFERREGGKASGLAFFDSAYRSVVSGLGAVLEQFGLLERRPPGYATWEKTGHGKWRYSQSTGFEAKNFPKVVSYIKALTELDTVNGNRHLKRAELEQAKARELFDSA